MRSRSSFHWLPCILFLFLTLAQAGIVTQTPDKASFDTATAAMTMVVDNFGTDPVYFCVGITTPISSTTSLPCSFGGPITPGLLQPGVTYSALDMGGSTTFNLENMVGYPDNPFLDAVGASNGLVAEFAAPVSAVGFRAGLAPGVTVRFDFAGGGSQTISGVTVPSNFSFVGFTSAARNIQRVTITSSTLMVGVDDFTFGATTVPEPGVAGMFGLGLASLVLLGRRIAR